MDNSEKEKIQAIIDKIAESQYTDTDLSKLRQLLENMLISASGSENIIVGKNIIGKIEGGEIQIGHRIYKQWNEEAVQSLIEAVKGNKKAIEYLVKTIQKTNSIHQEAKQSHLSYYSYEDEKLDECQGIETFISYAYEDRQLREEFKKKLAIFTRQKLIKIYSYKYKITENKSVIKIPQYFNQSSVILFLISPDFLDSDFCRHQINRAKEKWQNGKSLVIPIRLRPVDDKEEWFSSLKPLPCNNKPVTKWEDRDEAFLDIVQGIRKAIDI